MASLVLRKDVVQKSTAQKDYEQSLDSCTNEGGPFPVFLISIHQTLGVNCAVPLSSVVVVTIGAILPDVRSLTTAASGRGLPLNRLCQSPKLTKSNLSNDTYPPGKGNSVMGEFPHPSIPGLTQPLTFSKVRANPNLTAYPYYVSWSRKCVARRVRFGQEMQCREGDTVLG